MPMQATTTTPLFSAELTPNRSLGPRGIASVISLVVLLVVLPGLTMLSIGLLPILVLMAATALALGATIYLSLRPSKRREQVVVWFNQIECTSTDSHGVKTLRRFDPHSVRLVLHRDGDEKTLTMRLRAGKDELEIGSFLRPEDRSSFAKALGTALRKARAA